MSRLSVISTDKVNSTTETLMKEFTQRIIANPPGVCPVDTQLAFLKVCHAQTCGKCVPCRIGLGILEELLERVLDNTATMETVVMLSHKKPDSVINVKVEFGEGEGKVPLDNIAKRAEAYKPKERVTYKMIKGYIEAKYGFKVHTAYIAEVKRDLGLPMYDAPNAVEKLKQPRKHPTAEKVEAIKDALKHFGII